VRRAVAYTARRWGKIFARSESQSAARSVNKPRLLGLSGALLFVLALARSRHISPVPYSLLNYNSGSDTFLRQLMYLGARVCARVMKGCGGALPGAHIIIHLYPPA
jgi:hypothetical protein